MRTISVSTELAAPAEAVWAAVRTPEAFVHVARGMLRYPAAERHGRPWRAGDDIVGWTWLFGVLPFSRHRLVVVRVDDGDRTLETNEGGGIVRTWDHRIVVEPHGDRCRYEDRIDIDAGPLTLAIAGFAAVFYRYRQRRWRRLAPVLAATAVQPG